MAKRTEMDMRRAGSPVALVGGMAVRWGTLEDTTPCWFLVLGSRVVLKSWGMSLAAGGLYSQVFLARVWGGGGPTWSAAGRSPGGT